MAVKVSLEFPNLVAKMTTGIIKESRIPVEISK